MNFRIKFDRIVKKNNSLLCIGLDPELKQLPNHLKVDNEPLFIFNKRIIDATYDLVCAYKPNLAFYEAYGLIGLKQLKKTIAYLKSKHPQIPLVLDAKRVDIGNTNRLYAESVFDYWQGDAVTVYPYLGLDSLLPFLEYKNKLIILLVKTSNPDAKIFQDLKVKGKPLYLAMAQKISRWPYHNIGIFVGATYPQELKQVRQIFPQSIFLSAGIGAQKAQIQAAVKAGIDKNRAGIMFNASRSIIYASNSKDFAQKARISAKILRDQINHYRH